MTQVHPETVHRSAYARPLFILFVGILVLFITGLGEYYWLHQAEGSAAVLSLATEEQPDGAVNAWVRALPRDAIALADPMGDALAPVIGNDNQEIAALHERMVMLEGDKALLEPWLASGRLPVAGEREVLAGQLSRQDSFLLDGETFTVVGRLAPRTGSLGFSYVCLYDEELKEAHWSSAAQGWLHPDIAGYLEESGQNSASLDMEKFIGAPVKTPSYLTVMGFLGLMLVAWSGHKLFLVLYARLALRLPSLLGTLGATVVQERQLFKGVHNALYFVFFFTMFISARYPLISLRMTELIRVIFSNSEDLGYIGDAYASGNIFLAAMATFYNNYVVQTLGLTLAASIVPFAFGFFKTALSLAFVGLAMAPIWAGASLGYTYHCVTMFLELEAYILASFIAVYWARACYRALLDPARAWTHLKQGLRLYAGGIILTGVVLAVAAFYEAVTLIALR